jgi:hypothetical protein
MFLEYLGFLGLGAQLDFSFEFISRMALSLGSLVILIWFGFKLIKGWGAVMAIFLWTFLLLLINGQ